MCKCSFVAILSESPRIDMLVKKRPSSNVGEQNNKGSTTSEKQPENQQPEKQQQEVDNHIIETTQEDNVGFTIPNVGPSKEWNDYVPNKEDLLIQGRVDSGIPWKYPMEFNLEVEFRKPKFDLAVGQKFRDFRVFKEFLYEWNTREGYVVKPTKNERKKMTTKNVGGRGHDKRSFNAASSAKKGVNSAERASGGRKRTVREKGVAAVGMPSKVDPGSEVNFYFRHPDCTFDITTAYLKCDEDVKLWVTIWVHLPHPEVFAKKIDQTSRLTSKEQPENEEQLAAVEQASNQ
ncbi:hypothetical protein ACH5RR_034003 [Cinchona calisaya]|uniref:Uncharacterized protein n=1 Tax=Cinchona calisaya TaxID=153742 RepID=A0ABD2Y9M2_9GENT